MYKIVLFNENNLKVFLWSNLMFRKNSIESETPTEKVSQTILDLIWKIANNQSLSI